MYLIFIFHLRSPIGGEAPGDNVSSGLFMLDLLETLLNLLREKRICPTAIPLDEVRRCWVTSRFSDYGFSCVLGLAIQPVLSQFPICKMGLTVFLSLTRNRPLLRYYPECRIDLGYVLGLVVLSQVKRVSHMQVKQDLSPTALFLRANSIREDK